MTKTAARKVSAGQGSSQGEALWRRVHTAGPDCRRARRRPGQSWKASQMRSTYGVGRGDGTPGPSHSPLGTMRTEKPGSGSSQLLAFPVCWALFLALHMDRNMLILELVILSALFPWKSRLAQGHVPSTWWTWGLFQQSWAQVQVCVVPSCGGLSVIKTSHSVSFF